MKRYIFFTDTVSGVGGGQLYVAGKCRRLIREGWTPAVFAVKGGEVIIESLKEIENYTLPALAKRFNAVGKRFRERTAARVSALVNPGDTLVIEAYNHATALWAEYIASLHHATAMVYILSEIPPSLRPWQLRFMRLKLSQGLLYGILPRTIPAFLQEAEPDATFLQALGCGINGSGSAPVADPPSTPSSIPDGIFTILSLGRLDKPYVAALLRAVRDFALSHPSDSIRITLVGDHPDLARRSRLLAILEEAPNLKLDFRGFLYPVVEEVFDMSHMAVGCSGSARVTHDAGVPTLTIDVADHKAIGILGETTSNRLHRSAGEPPVEIRAALEEIWSDFREGRRRRPGHARRMALARGSKDDDAIWERHRSVAAIRQTSWFDCTHLRPASPAEWIYRLLNP